MSLRRTNKSAKVPNVKLRPAAPAARPLKSRKSPSSSSTGTHENACDSEGEASFIDVCPRPFRNIVLCATGVSDKMSLFKQAMDLGAVSYNDLTDRVTHLIAAEPGSAKYKCALENRIPIMHPSWIIESHEIWLKGDDVNLKESVEKYRLPILSGVILSLSGFDDIAQRTRINKLVTQNGGTYVKNIERPVRVTHLLCASSNEEVTEKMHYAEKFNQRGEANIKVVWEEWLWDSLEFRGRFDEEAYKVTKPPPQRRMPPREPATPPPQSSPPPEEVQARPQNSHVDLLAPGSNEEEEVASAKKRVPTEMLQIWGNLLKPRGFEVAGNRLVRSPSKSQSARDSTKEAVRAASPDSPIKRRMEGINMTKSLGDADAPPASVLSTFRRVNSFAPVGAGKDASAVMGDVVARRPFARAPTVGPTSSFLAHPSVGSRTEQANLHGASDLPLSSQQLMAEIERGNQGAQAQPIASSSSDKLTNLFNGLKFRALGEAKGPSVRTAVEDAGGRFVTDGSDEEVDYVIVRLVSGSALYHDEPDEQERKKFRTECWLERCIFDEQVCDPDEHVTFTPIKVLLPIVGAEHINLSYSGLDQSEVCWVRRLVRAIGANLAPSFSRRSTHLLCPSGIGAKADKAREWGVPVVDMAWLGSIAETGEVPLDSMAGNIKKEEPFEVDVSVSLLTSEQDRKGKGKGKERANLSCIITDITNEGQSEFVPAGDQEPSILRLAGGLLGGPKSEDETFGAPNSLLGGPRSPSTGPATGTLPPRSRSVTLPPSPEAERKSGPAHILVRDSRGPSLAAVKTERVLGNLERVPSSESPSPLKHPSMAAARGASASPAKGGVGAAEAATILRESVVSLLGKRPSTEDEDTKSGGGNGQHCRIGKRARPPTRVKSASKNPGADDEDPEVLPAFVPPGGFHAHDAGDESISISMQVDCTRSSAGESVRVTYQDPGQCAEKKKLMKLLGNGDEEEGDSSKAGGDARIAKAPARGKGKKSQR